MIFAQPTNLWYFLLVIVVIVLVIFEYRHGRKTMVQLFSTKVYGSFAKLHSIKWFLSRFVFVAALSGLIFALAEPSWGEDFKEEERVGLDLVIVLDVSRSMLVKDVVPDRLTRAREILLGLVSQLQGVRIAVVAFRGAGTIVVPLTEDMISVEQALNTLGPDSFTKKGTGLSDGLARGMSAFTTESLRYRAMVLASDGGDHDPRLETMVLDAARSGITIYTIGLGTEIGGAVPGLELNNTVISRLNSQDLEMLAKVSRGKYLGLEDASSYNALADLIKEDISRMSAQGFRIVDIAQYRLFVLASLLLLLVFVVLKSLKIKGQW